MRELSRLRFGFTELAEECGPQLVQHVLTNLNYGTGHTSEDYGTEHTSESYGTQHTSRNVSPKCIKSFCKNICFERFDFYRHGKLSIMPRSLK